MSESVQMKLVDGVMEIILSRPPANAIDLATSREMGDAFRRCRDDESVRVILLHTAGQKFFCAGWDLKAAAAGDSVVGDYGVGGFGGLQELPRMNKPVIAAVEGMAVGGGFELALSADLIYASADSSFALPRNSCGHISRCGDLQITQTHTLSQSPWICY